MMIAMRWAVAALAVVALAPGTAHGDAGVGIDPGEISGLPPVEPGEPVTVAVQVRNPGTSGADYEMIAQPLSGTPELPVGEGWVTFAPATFSLAGGEVQEVQATLVVPDDAGPGDYLALLTAQLVVGENAAGGAAVGAAVATKFLFTVPAGLGDDAGSGGVPLWLPIVGFGVLILGGGFWLFKRSGIRLKVERPPS